MKQKTNRIREFRKALGWTQGELARRLNVSTAQVSDLETGKCQLTQRWMDAIARELAVDPVDLLPSAPNRPVLCDEELALITQYRRASPAERTAIARVAESLTGFTVQPPEEDWPGVPRRAA